ncbi:FKBP-type peptidyl-prolyl cis-trans isomerase [Polaribacter sp. Hel_I_88]|uniref:FKBP-type peptidyl-prolyl cis-trans isomerase n=1 Tax=Polaribacter sp. Hel_I_88 TaxID=1250006 RepID=UPI000B22EB26|nr:FKBP-type peptidyl-prolyl cis-trans isomerase [Polaribacter sp. Hel_I_88]
MKSYAYLFLSLILFTSCLNDDDTIELQTEADIIKYINDNNLNGIKTDSGLYYVINEEGTGNTPKDDSVVNIDYKISFLDGSSLGQSESEIIELRQIIPGLREGIKLFKQGGEGIILIPYELAYGLSGNNTGTIPGGKVLVFEIKVNVADYLLENEAAILNYLDTNNLIATKTDSGLYYVVNNEGTGANPTSNSNVTVAYKGYFLDGTVFDESDADGISFNLNQVIPGWTEGITYFKEGGDGILLIPYNLGYGVYGNNTIPRVSVLIFDVNLKSIN